MFWVSKHEQVFAMDDVCIKRTGIVITNVEYISSFNNRPTQNDYFTVCVLLIIHNCKGFLQQIMYRVLKYNKYSQKRRVNE